MKHVAMTLLLLIVASQLDASESPAGKGNFLITMPVFKFEMTKTDYNGPYPVDPITDTTKVDFMAGNYELGIQYFMLPGLAVGGMAGYSSEDDDDISTKSTKFGPMVSYYFNTDQKFMPYLGIGFIYEKEDAKSIDSNSYYDHSTIYSLKLNGGLAYMINRHFALYGEITYSRSRVKIDARDYSGAMGEAGYGYTVNQSVDRNSHGLTTGIKAFF